MQNRHQIYIANYTADLSPRICHQRIYNDNHIHVVGSLNVMKHGHGYRESFASDHYVSVFDDFSYVCIDKAVSWSNLWEFRC